MKIPHRTLNLLIDCHHAVKEKNNKIPEIKYERIQIDDFKICETLANGSYGDVFFAVKNGKHYALKRISMQTVKSHPDTALFMAERNCLVATKNSKYLTYIDYSFFANNYLWFAMNFCPGGDLISVLARMNTLPLEYVQFYAGELLLAIEEIHALGFIHRDIKPDNIFITADGHIKLGDFGSCAQLIDGKVKSNTPVGTPDYISPEILISINSEQSYGIEVDIWSFGIVVYEMANGNPPFYAERLKVTYRKIENIEYTLVGPEEVMDICRFTICKPFNRKNIAELKKARLFDGFDFNNPVPVYIPNKDWQNNFIKSDTKIEDDDRDKDKDDLYDFVGFTHDISANLEPDGIYTESSICEEQPVIDIALNKIKSPKVIDSASKDLFEKKESSLQIGPNGRDSVVRSKEDDLNLRIESVLKDCDSKELANKTESTNEAGLKGQKSIVDTRKRMIERLSDKDLPVETKKIDIQALYNSNDELLINNDAKEQIYKAELNNIKITPTRHLDIPMNPKLDLKNISRSQSLGGSADKSDSESPFPDLKNFYDDEKIQENSYLKSSPSKKQDWHGNVIDFNAQPKYQPKFTISSSNLKTQTFKEIIDKLQINVAKEKIIPAQLTEGGDNSKALDSSIFDDSSSKKPWNKLNEHKEKVSDKLMFERTQSLPFPNANVKNVTNIVPKTQAGLNRLFDSLTLFDAYKAKASTEKKKELLVSFNYRIKEVLFRFKMDLESIQQRYTFVYDNLEQLIASNALLKKELRTRTVKIEKQHERVFEEQKKTIRLMRDDNRELKQKLEIEKLSKLKFVDEIKYLRDKLKKAKKHVDMVRNFNVQFVKFGSKEKEEAILSVHNGKFMLENKKINISENLSQVFVYSLAINELHYVNEKKRGLILKLCILSEREKSASAISVSKNEEDINNELVKEEKILAALNKMYPLLDDNGKKQAQDQIRGCKLRIKHLTGEKENSGRISSSSDINAVKHKHFEFNNHLFEKTTFDHTHFCYKCSSPFYGAVNQAYECIECKMTAHPSCVTLIEESCELYIAIKKGRVLYVMMNSVEEKERLFKCL